LACAGVIKNCGVNIMKKPEFTHDAICRLIGFFNLLGYESYAKELEHRQHIFCCKRDALLTESKYNQPDIIDTLHINVKNKMAEFENAVEELKKTFYFYLDKITIAPPEVINEGGAE
jgi:hypothetical protein